MKTDIVDLEDRKASAADFRDLMVKQNNISVKLAPLMENHATLHRILERVIEENNDAERIDEIITTVELNNVRLHQKLNNLTQEVKGMKERVQANEV